MTPEKRLYISERLPITDSVLAEFVGRRTVPADEMLMIVVGAISELEILVRGEALGEDFADMPE